MAGSTVGALRVNLGLNSAKFFTGAKRVESRAAKLGRSLKVIGVGAAAGATALLALSRRSAESIDASAKLAASTDTTTSSIQTLKRASELAGVSVGQLEAGTIALTKRLSQAAFTGKGPAVDALEAINLEAEQLQKLPLDERIALIQTNLNKYADASDRAAIASALFGDRAGAVFARINADVIAQASDELDRFGVKVSDVDAANIERANDALSSLGLIVEGVGNKIAANAAPSLERLANGLGRIFEQGSPVGKALDFLARNIDLLAVAAVGLASAISVSLIGALVAFLGPIGLAVGAVAGLAAGAVVLAEKFGLIDGSGRDAAAGTDELNAAMNEFRQTAAPDAANKAITMANANYELARSALQAAKAEVAKSRALIATAEERAGGKRTKRGSSNNLRQGREGEAAALERLAAAEQAIANAARQQAAVTAELSESNLVFDETTGLVAEAITEVADSIDKTTGKVPKLKKAVKETVEEVEAAAITMDDVSQGLAGVFTNAINGTESLRSGLAKLAQQLANQALQKGISSLIGGIGGGGGSAGGIASIIGGFFGAKAIGGRASGPTLVGERGPELVNIPKGSSVTDAQRTRQMLATPPAAPNVNVQPQIVVLDDPRKIGDYLDTPEGEAKIVRINSRNK